MDRLKDGQKDRHTLFYRTLPAEAGGAIRVTEKPFDCISIHTNFY